MKALLNMSTKKISVILGLFIVVSVAVGIFLYMNNPKIKFMHLMNKEYKSFVSVLDKAKESELALLSKDNTVTSAGSLSFDLSLANDMFDGTLNSFIAVINDFNVDYQYGSDPLKNNTYFKFNSNIGTEDFLDMELYQMGDKKYMYLNGIYDKYIESESIDFISTQGGQTEDVIYLVDKIKMSFFSSLKTSDFTTEPKTIEINNQSMDTNKITLKLTNERLREIFKIVLTDLKNDTKAIEILNNLNGQEDMKKSLEETIASLDKEQLLEKDIVIDIYVKDGAIVKLDIMDGETEIIEYLSYVAFNPIKEIIIFDKEKVTMSALFETKSPDDISYKVSLSDNQIIANGTITKLVAVSTENKTWDLSFTLDLALTYDNSLLGSLKINTQTTTKVGEEVKMLDITNTVKEEDMTEEENNEISTKIFEKISDAIPVADNVIEATQEITY